MGWKLPSHLSNLLPRLFQLLYAFVIAAREKGFKGNYVFQSTNRQAGRRSSDGDGGWRFVFGLVVGKVALLAPSKLTFSYPYPILFFWYLIPPLTTDTLPSPFLCKWQFAPPFFYDFPSPNLISVYISFLIYSAYTSPRLFSIVSPLLSLSRPPPPPSHYSLFLSFLPTFSSAPPRIRPRSLGFSTWWQWSWGLRLKVLDKLFRWEELGQTWTRPVWTTGLVVLEKDVRKRWMDRGTFGISPFLNPVHVKITFLGKMEETSG